MEPTTKQTTITLPVTVGGTTRDVEFSGSPYAGETEVRMVSSRRVFTGHIGRGAKTHNVSIMAWRGEGETPAEQEAWLRSRGYRRSPSPSIVDGPDGSVWGVQLIGHVLNRQVYVTGWRQDAEGTSQHIMEPSVRSGGAR